jgi:hypothetical protein
MNMGPAGFVKQPGNEVFVVVQDRPADRTYPGPVPFQAIGAACNIHKPVRFPHGGKGRRFYPLTVQKPDRANRTGPGRPGFTLKSVIILFFSDPLRKKSRNSRTEKKAVPKPEQNQSDNDKAYNLKIRIHTFHP